MPRPLPVEHVFGSSVRSCLNPCDAQCPLTANVDRLPTKVDGQASVPPKIERLVSGPAVRHAAPGRSPSSSSWVPGCAAWGRVGSAVSAGGGNCDGLGLPEPDCPGDLDRDSGLCAPGDTSQAVRGGADHGGATNQVERERVGSRALPPGGLRVGEDLGEFRCPLLAHLGPLLARGDPSRGENECVRYRAA